MKTRKGRGHRYSFKILVASCKEIIEIKIKIKKRNEEHHCELKNDVIIQLERAITSAAEVI